jgi:hypothetical protein
MKIEYKNPEKRKGIFIWEIDVNFLSKESDFRFKNAGEEEMIGEAKKVYGSDAVCFPSLNRANTFILWVSQIKDWDSQKVSYSDYGEEKKDYNDKENGNLIGFFDFSKSILGRKQLRINFTLEEYETKLQTDTWETAPYDRSSSLFRKYTKSERQLGQTDNVVMLAKEVTKTGSSPFAKAKMIYNWISENITYKDSSTKRGAIRVFESRDGNSAEISFLYITLLRSVEIPARLVSGAWGEIEKKQDFHFWVEFYLEGVGWIPVDCAKKMFGDIDSKRIIFSKGENILLEKAPDQSDIFGINYRRVFFMQPEVIYLNKQEPGIFAIKQNKYLLIKG